MKLRLTTPDSKALEGFRYLWLKSVKGFSPAVHCASCLKGEYTKGIGPGWEPAAVVSVPGKPGDLFYLCGVASPYRWEKNAHIALRICKGAVAALALYNGATITIEGAEKVPFDDKAALEHYPTKGKSYHTCRNFQFGAALKHNALA